MKKLNAKIVFSAIVAVAMAAASAVSVSAADYGGSSETTTPTTTTSGKSMSTFNAALPTAGSGSSASTPAGTTTTPAAGDQGEVVGVVTDATIEAIIADALANGKDLVIPVAEDSNGKLVIKADLIALIQQSGVTVTLEVTNEDGLIYYITIDPATIEEIGDIDVAMDIVIAEAGSTISNVAIPADSIVIEPNQKGDFGMTLVVTLPADELADLDIEDASMFYISNSGKISDVTSALSVNDDGSASAAISHASAYVITAADFTGGDVDADNDDWSKIDDDDDDEEFIVTGENDANPHTGVTLAFGAIAASAAAVAITAKKRK